MIGRLLLQLIFTLGLLMFGVIVFGWHALRLWEGRDSSDIRHALRKASERATPKLKLDRARVLCPD